MTISLRRKVYPSEEEGTQFILDQFAKMVHEQVKADIRERYGSNQTIRDKAQNGFMPCTPSQDQSIMQPLYETKVLMFFDRLRRAFK